MTNEKKLQLKKLLRTISNDVEKDGLDKMDAVHLARVFKAFEDDLKESEDNYTKLLEGFTKYASASHKHSQTLVEQFTGFNDALSKKLEDVAGKITTSYEKNKPFNAAGVYKDMINQLSAVNKSIKDKPVPAWNWPQYASVGVRDSSFKNIDPALNEIATTVGDNTVTIAASGTAVQLSTTSVPCYAVYIQAHESNTGTIVVGSSTVKAALSGRRGFALYNTQVQKFMVSNLNLLYVDSTQSSDKVTYYYESK